MSNVNIKPLADRVLVQPAAAEEKNRFRIIHSGHSQRKASERNGSGHRNW